MAAASSTPTPDELDEIQPDEQPRRGRPARASNLRIEEDWKGMPALLDGDRLVTRSSDIANVERMKEDLEARGKRPFSSKVAQVEDPEDN